MGSMYGPQGLRVVVLIQRGDVVQCRLTDPKLVTGAVKTSRDVTDSPRQLFDKLRVIGRDGTDGLELQVVTGHQNAADVAATEVAFKGFFEPRRCLGIDPARRRQLSARPASKGSSIKLHILKNSADNKREGRLSE
jgi:hypothetical protein